MDIKTLYGLFRSHMEISTDTREIKKNSLFFALKGDNFNGNKFADVALAKGAKYAIIDEIEYKKTNQHIVVNDVLKTLQDLANYHRKNLTIPFIGITGTNGKTTTKEFIHAVLSKKYKTAFTQGNLNNHIGVPLTLLSIKKEHEIAIIEMGANHIGEIDFLCNIAEPNYGIITNIGTAHIEGFGSVEGIKKTKNELYLYIKKTNGLLFVNNRDKILIQLSEYNTKKTYGDSSSDFHAELIESIPKVKIQWKNKVIESNLYGNYNFENILAAIAIGKQFKVEEDNIKDAIEEYYPKNNRSQLIKTDSNTIFLDAYNANPTSMNGAINTFLENKEQKKIMILGDMLELGNISQKEHQSIVDKISEAKVKAILVGNEFDKVKNKKHLIFVNDYNDTIEYLKKIEIKDYAILIKGSRGVKLEKVADYIQEIQ